MSPSSTPIASAHIGDDRITIEYVATNRLPAKIKITWPTRFTLIDPQDFPDVANTVAKLFARGSVVIASLKAGGEPMKSIGNALLLLATTLVAACTLLTLLTAVEAGLLALVALAVVLAFAL